MSPAAVLALCALVVCCGAHLEADPADSSTLGSLISDLHGDDLPSGAVTTWPARTGPQLILDTEYPFGTGTRVAGPNGHTGLLVSRDDHPGYKFDGVLLSERDDLTFLLVYHATIADANGATRGYLFTSRETSAVQSDRFGFAQNGNTSDNPLNKLGFYNQSEPIVDPGVNPGWHRYYDANGAPVQTIVGLQANVWVFGRRSFVVRNGVVLGHELANMWRSQQRHFANYACLFHSPTHIDPTGATNTFFDGTLYQFKCWRGAASHAEAVAMSQAAMLEYGIGG